jgi:hypothetical protein
MNGEFEVTACMYALADAVRALSVDEIVRCRSILATRQVRRPDVAELLRQSDTVLATLSALARGDDE